MNQKGIGIIGCGAISRAHVNGYRAFPERCDVRAVYDVRRESADELVRWMGGGVDVCGSMRELLARDDIDIVSVCTPPFAHKEPVLDALRAGKHVLCEKPFAPSLADCDEMIGEAEARGLALGVSLQGRFRRDYRQLKHMLDNRLLGDIRFAQMNGLYWRGESYYEAAWRGTWEKQSGGVMMNQAIHPLDIFVWLLGDAESVLAEMDTFGRGIEVEDFAAATIRFRSGALGQVTCTANSVQTEVSLKLSGATRAVGIPLSFHAVREDERGHMVPDEEGVRELARMADEIGDGPKGHAACIGDLLRAIEEGSSPDVDGAEARRVIEVITALYKSASTGERVKLPIGRDDPWYTTDGILAHVRRGRRGEPGSR
ncbi:Gfo/Idh/MocA family protein [Paenibacillus flagellatus]|nr:Gfo/Idh/MocA family oxidoreductase [Paenibacillus flagellatus]